MKKITFAILISLLITTAGSILRNASEVEAMTDKLIRLHVIANSDSDADQSLKLKVRDGVAELISELLSDCDSKKAAVRELTYSLDEINDAANKIVSQVGCEAVCTLQREEFPEKFYDGFTLPAGEYDSLCIRIGEANGHNWWCVCYPQLCFGSAVSVEDCGVLTDGELVIIKEPEKVKYKLWCFELIRKLRKLFD